MIVRFCQGVNVKNKLFPPLFIFLSFFSIFVFGINNHLRGAAPHGPTTVTPSFSSDSPNTRMKSISSTWISSKTASTATGSTAEISEENRKMCSIGKSLTGPKSPVRLNAYKEIPENKDV